jgi:hypothetical protein
LVLLLLLLLLLLALSMHTGDVVFLASDGIADNFDPVVRKQASSRAIGEGSSRQPGVAALSPAKCHKMGIADMAGVLKDACGKLQAGRNSLSGSSKQQQVVQEHLQAAARYGEQQQEQQQLQQQREATAYVQQQLQQLEQQAAGLTQQQQQQRKNFSNASPPPLEGIDGRCLTAQATVQSLLSFVERGTAAQRQVLEQANAGGCKGPDELGDLIANLPGKMDHASVVAYKVG